MKVDATLRGVELGEIAAHARRYEEAGFDGLFVTETNGNPFLAIALAAGTTRRMQLGTGIALAFPRSPMDTAYTAWDLQALTGGRFVLGLGSQVRAHVERRFGSQWFAPAARMAEYVRALRAIWSSWADGSPLDFQGEHYRHTLMPPEFRPRRHGHPRPKVMLAGVRGRMVQVAGEHADGLLVHVFHTPAYLREVVVPAIERGLERSGRERDDFELSAGVFIASDETEREAVRRRVAFYGSTPGYRQVLEMHGWGELHTRLHELSRTGGWDRMAELVDDEVLDAFCVQARDGARLGEQLRARYDGIAERVNLNGGALSNLDAWAPLAQAVRSERRPPPAASA